MVNKVKCANEEYTSSLLSGITQLVKIIPLYMVSEDGDKNVSNTKLQFEMSRRCSKLPAVVI